MKNQMENLLNLVKENFRLEVDFRIIEGSNNMDNSSRVDVVNKQIYISMFDINQVVNDLSLSIEEVSVVILSHELGHLLDFKMRGKRFYQNPMFAEKQAWNFAKEFLKMLGLENYPNFEIIKNYGLQSYKEYLEKGDKN